MINVFLFRIHEHRVVQDSVCFHLSSGFVSFRNYRVSVNLELQLRV